MSGKGGLEKEFFDKKESSEESSKSPKSFDMVKEAAKKSKVELPPDKAQHTDIGSSSDSSKNIDILEKFKHIGGNTDLANAKVILLGEAHIPRHYNDIVDFMNTHAKDGDLVLVESCQAGDDKINKYLYALNRALWYEHLTDDEEKQANQHGKEHYIEKFRQWVTEGKFKPFKKAVEVYGWDNVEVLKETHRNNDKYVGIKEIEALPQEEQEALMKRDRSMLETIGRMRNEFPGQRLFVIAGFLHFTESRIITPQNLEKQDYIALMPKQDMSQEEFDDFRRIRNEGIG